MLLRRLIPVFPDESELRKKTSQTTPTVTAPASTSAPTTSACRPVVNPYPGTRYEGVSKVAKLGEKQVHWRF